MQPRAFHASMLLAALPAAVLAQAPAAANARAQEADALRTASLHLARIDEDLKRTLVQAGEARDDKDLAKLVCVDEKLDAMRRLGKTAQQANGELVSALAQGDAQGAAIVVAKIAIARAKVEAIRGEAERCLGQLLYRSDETTSVEVREPAGLPGGDPDGTALGVATRKRPPEEGSPFLGAEPQAQRPARGP